MTDSPIPNPTPTLAPKAKGLIERVQAILLRPVPTWDIIAAEGGSVKSVLMGYVLPLAAIGPVLFAILMTVFTLGFGLIPGLIGGITQFVGNLIGVFFLAVLTNLLAPSFGGQKDFVQAFKLSAYSLTAAWVGGLAPIVPGVGQLVLLLAVLYGLYLFYLGVPKLMKAPQDKSAIYTAAMVAVTAVIGIVLSIFIWIAALTTGLGLFGAMGGFGGGHRGAVVSDDGKMHGTMNIGGTAVDLNKLQQAGEQMAAEASAQQNGTTTVKVADPQVLLALMPASYMGAARSDDSTSSGGAAGISAAQARGSYVINGNTISLEVADLGSVSGLGAMAAAMNINSSSSSATGYSKISTQNGQMVSEEYDRDSKYGKYTVVRNGKISVEASGTVDSIDTLKNLVNSVDGGKLEALSKG